MNALAGAKRAPSLARGVAVPGGLCRARLGRRPERFHAYHFQHEHAQLILAVEWGQQLLDLAQQPPQALPLRVRPQAPRPPPRAARAKNGTKAANEPTVCRIRTRHFQCKLRNQIAADEKMEARRSQIGSCERWR
eukprot:COSAG06_NODE_13798_length_1218_cov_1.309205_1_plen_135_part_00